MPEPRPRPVPTAAVSLRHLSDVGISLGNAEAPDPWVEWALLCHVGDASPLNPQGWGAGTRCTKRGRATPS
jgi:hypothetical protein